MRRSLQVLSILAAAFALSGASVLSTSLASAAPSPPRSEPAAQPATQPSTSAQPTPEGEDAERNRALAELEYKKGYKDSEEAKKLKKAGKDKDAKDKFTKALKRFEDAVKVYEPYAEAWNMIGYCRRNLGDLRHAFDAYDRSLALNPEYEEAHEYLGELYAMSGNLEKAKEQLAWLQAKKSDEAEELAEAIEAAEKGKKAVATQGTAGAAAATTGEAQPAAATPPDSTAGH